MLTGVRSALHDPNIRSGVRKGLYGQEEGTSVVLNFSGDSVKRVCLVPFLVIFMNLPAKRVLKSINKQFIIKKAKS